MPDLLNESLLNYFIPNFHNEILLNGHLFGADYSKIKSFDGIISGCVDVYELSTFRIPFFGRIKYNRKHLDNVVLYSDCVSDYKLDLVGSIPDFAINAVFLPLEDILINYCKNS